MNTQLNSEAASQSKSCLCRLCSAKIKDCFDMSISVGDETGEAPCFQKKIKCKTEFGLATILLVGSAIFVSVSLMHFICKLIKRK